MTICFVHGFSGSPWCLRPQLERPTVRGDCTKTGSIWRHKHSHLWPLERNESKTRTTNQNTFVWFLHMAWCSHSTAVRVLRHFVWWRRASTSCARVHTHVQENANTPTPTPPPPPHTEAFYKSASEIKLHYFYPALWKHYTPSQKQKERRYSYLSRIGLYRLKISQTHGKKK